MSQQSPPPCGHLTIRPGLAAPSSWEMGGRDDRLTPLNPLTGWKAIASRQEPLTNAVTTSLKRRATSLSGGTASTTRFKGVVVIAA